MNLGAIQASVEVDLSEFAQVEGQSFLRSYSAMLAALLSNAGVEASLGRRVDWSSPSVHLLESREAETRNGSYGVLDREHYRPIRESLLRENAPAVLQSFFRQLQRPIDAFLEIERVRNKGGASKRFYRDFAVQELAKLFAELVDARPTGTPHGKFCTLCELVLEELDEDTKGLESAIQRILKELRS